MTEAADEEVATEEVEVVDEADEVDSEVETVEVEVVDVVDSVVVTEVDEVDSHPEEVDEEVLPAEAVSFHRELYTTTMTYILTNRSRWW